MKGFVVALILVSLLFFGCAKPYSSEIQPPPQGITPNTVPEEQGCACIKIYKPVCGTDGKTYGNSCEAGCSKTPMAYEGECKKCSDSDFGKDIYVNGTTAFGNETFSDICLGGGTSVLEYSCGDVGMENKAYACPSGYLCMDGGCRINQKPVTPKLKCLDSDNGKDFYAKGNVTDNYGDSFVDFCTTRDNLREYFCEGIEVKAAIKTCALDERCSDGKCIKNEPTCFDSDGSDEKTVGQVTTSDSIMAISSYKDQCNDYRSVKEYICTGNYGNVTIINCEIGMECFENRCISKK